MPVAYPDSGLSYGFGHHGVRPGDTITLDDAFVQLEKDVKERREIIQKWIKVPLEPYQIDALTAAYFNNGSKMLAVCYLINNGLTEDALNLLLRYCYKDGKVDPGLLKRLEQEVNIFRTGDYGDLSKFRVYEGVPTATNWHEQGFGDEFPI